MDNVLSVRLITEDKYFNGVRELNDMVKEYGERKIKRVTAIYYGLVIALE